MLTLVRRLATGNVFFKGGDATAEVLLEMRGIFVGVSFGLPDVEFMRDEGGGSLTSFDTCELIVPTEGDPAIVGN